MVNALPNLRTGQGSWANEALQAYHAQRNSSINEPIAPSVMEQSYYVAVHLGMSQGGPLGSREPPSYSHHILPPVGHHGEIAYQGACGRVSEDQEDKE